MLPLISIAVPTVVLWLLSRMLRARKLTDVAGKVIVVTGASSGLGRACAILLAKRGAKLVLCSRNESQLQKVKDHILSNKDPAVLEPVIVQIDLADPESITKASQSIVKEVGHVDILVNNGGISCRGAVEETSVETYRRLMEVNFFGTVALTTALLPAMLERQSGQVLCVSSVQGKLGIPFRSAYGASKHACQAFFDSLRAEVADRNVQVSIYNPGYIQTSLSVNALSGDGSNYGVMDESTKTGMSAETAAERIVDMIERRDKDVIHADIAVRIVIYLKNLVPNMFAFVMQKRARSAIKKQKIS